MPWRPSASAQAWLRAIWPALAAAWLCSSGRFDGIEPEQAPAQRDGAGGDDDDLAAIGLERGDVFGQIGQPGRAQLAGLAVDEQGRADLDGQAAIGGEGVVMLPQTRSAPSPLRGGLGRGKRGRKSKGGPSGLPPPPPNLPRRGRGVVPAHVAAIEDITAPSWVRLCGGRLRAWRPWRRRACRGCRKAPCRCPGR